MRDGDAPRFFCAAEQTQLVGQLAGQLAGPANRPAYGPAFLEMNSEKGRERKRERKEGKGWSGEEVICLTNKNK